MSQDDGYDLPGPEDCFADGTPAVEGRSSQLALTTGAAGGSSGRFGRSSGSRSFGASRNRTMDMEIGKVLTICNESTGRLRRRVDPNPAAGTIRARELHGAWMQQTNSRIAEDNEKAQGVCFEKRCFALARQTSAGLAHIGVRYEMTTLANILKDACKFRDQGASMARGSEKRLKELEKAVEIYEASIRYDMKAVAGLLDLTVERMKTFGRESQRYEIQATMRGVTFYE